MRSTAGATPLPLLGDLARPIVVVDVDTRIERVETLLRDEPAVTAVLAVSGADVFLIDRAYLDSVLTGRLGFGRALLHRSTLRSHLPSPALVLPSAMTWDDAARAALARPTGRKAVPVVVAFDDGRLGVAPVGPLVDFLSARYQSMALHDDLTGLGNRRLLTELGTQIITRGGTPVLMLIDLNRFKEINDTLGHAHGDALVQQVATALEGACAPGAAFRLGGDEFVVLFDDIDDLPGRARRTGTAERFTDAARYLLRAIQGPFTVAGVPITVEAALGVAHGAQPGLDDLGKLLGAADAAMYAAKRDRTPVEVWHPDLAAAESGDLAIQTELRSAIERGELVLHYQPLVDAVSGQTVSLEALVRWQHPQRGLLSPAAFLPHAERSDVIHPLTEYVLAEAIRQAARWHHQGWPVPVAVNLAAPVLTSDHIVTLIARLLAQAGLPSTALIVEITESAVVARPDQAARRLQAIRDLGVRVAMDDFGTGYTSLALLSSLPLDELKLDRTFVMRVHHRQERVIVEAVARMAHGLGLTLVAEGVEDAGTAATLAEIGANLLQGYYFSRPVPPDRLSHPSGAEPPLAMIA
ncbi:putative bifunctional diguanylate cyclase/phosphodiesterase [Actinoplanes sp. CA-131856]